VQPTPGEAFTERKGRSMTEFSYRNSECVESIIGAFVQEFFGFHTQSAGRGFGQARMRRSLPSGDIVSFVRATYPGSPYLPVGRGEALARLAEGIKVDSIGRTLRIRGIDPCPVLFAALQSGDFITVPRIDDDNPIRSVKRRHDSPGNSDGVEIITDGRIIRGDQVHLHLLPPVHDAKSALVNYLTRHPGTSKSVAKEVVRNEYGFAITDYVFTRLWPDARKAAGLPERALPGPRGPRRKFDKRSI
jgi:hypothetical protein